MYCLSSLFVSYCVFFDFFFILLFFLIKKMVIPAAQLLRLETGYRFFFVAL